MDDVDYYDVQAMIRDAQTELRHETRDGLAELRGDDE